MSPCQIIPLPALTLARSNMLAAKSENTQKVQYYALLQSYGSRQRRLCLSRKRVGE
jgi:hypothetical protein